MMDANLLSYKKLEGFDYDYRINESGDVIKVRGNSIYRLKGGMFSNGYRFVALTRHGESSNHSVHRLVALSFIPNPHDLPCVNHMDGNKLNNHVDNLEWCTYSYNLKHAIETGLVESQCKIERSVEVRTQTKVMRFDTMADCCKYFGFTKAWLGNYIRKHGNPCQYGDYVIFVYDRRN